MTAPPSSNDQHLMDNFAANTYSHNTTPSEHYPINRTSILMNDYHSAEEYYHQPQQQIPNQHQYFQYDNYTVYQSTTDHRNITTLENSNGDNSYFSENKTMNDPGELQTNIPNIESYAYHSTNHHIPETSEYSFTNTTLTPINNDNNNKEQLYYNDNSNQNEVLFYQYNNHIQEF